MKRQDSLDAKLAALFAEEELPSDHPNDSQLLDFQAGRLEPVAREGVAEHLAACEECSRFMLASKAFAGPQESFPEVESTEVRSGWHALERQLGLGKSAAGDDEGGADLPRARAEWAPSEDTSPPWWNVPAFGWGLAATLLFVVVGLQVSHGRDAAKLAELESWKEKTDRWTSNIEVHSVEPWGTVRGSGEVTEARPGDVLLLYAGVDSVEADAVLEVLARNGEVIHRVSELRGLEEGVVRLLLPRGKLEQGDYEIDLLSDAGIKIQSYRLRIVAEEDP